MNLPPAIGAALVFALGGAVAGLLGRRKLGGFAFPAWVLTFVTAAMVWPRAFDTWMGIDLKNLMVPLVQVIMFGMGTKLSAGDFVRVFVVPKPVMIGLFLHYTVMPLSGYALARLFGFPPEIAAGLVLVGSVSSGTASNVIAYLAGGNVALAVTITACSTLVSPFLTPLLMQVLAGRMVTIDFLKMMLEILNMVIVPVAAGLAANRVLYGGRPWSNRAGPLGWLAGGCALAAAAMALAPAAGLGAWATLRGGAVVGSALIGLVALAKLALSVLARRPNTWMDRALPLVSMAAICLIVAIIMARSRDKLLVVGGALILAAMLHNAIGYLLGYWLARALHLDETTCRTIAIEVGMQNGGMATGLAMSVLKSADAALAPAIFGSWMNISGSMLAGWWRRRPVPALAPAPLGAASRRTRLRIETQSDQPRN